MPSIYSHENACWGIRRSSCDVFKCDFNDEFQTNKIRERDCHSIQTSFTPNTPFVQYSVSSNGYYGYQPPKAAQVALPSSEIAMDVEDISTMPTHNSIYDNTNVSHCVGFNPDVQQKHASRKRQMTCDSLDGSKRVRQEEAEMKILSEEPRRKEYFSHPKCLMAHFV